MITYGKHSKILRTSCLPKWPRQTGQTKSRSSLIRVFPVFYSDKHFVNRDSSPDCHILFGNRKEKSLKF